MYIDGDVEFCSWFEVYQIYFDVYIIQHFFQEFICITVDLEKLPAQTIQYFSSPNYEVRFYKLLLVFRKVYHRLGTGYS